MSLYIPGTTGGFVHTGAETLDRQLREGDGIVWTGDPRLELRMGILEETKHGVKTGRVARRYEVWRNMEDGREERIGHWNVHEFGMILHDVALMLAGATGRAPGVESRIDAANAKAEAAAAAKYRDVMGDMLEHAAKLRHDRTEGPNVFRQVGGTRDE